MSRRHSRSITRSITQRSRTIMKWRTRSVQSRADISFFIFIIFFAVFGIIVLTEVLFLERHGHTGGLRLRYNEDLQGWEQKADADGTEDRPPPPPAHAPLDGVWQPVGGTKYKFFVYSAYVERRTVPAVRIIAATKTRGFDHVVCQLWLPNNESIVVQAKVQIIRENWNLKYSAAYVLCLLSGSGVSPTEAAGASVSVLAVTASTNPPTNMLVVLETQPRAGIEGQIHVCVKPLHFNFGRDEWLLEWMEMNRLLGVNHFYMYNKTINNKTSCILDDYRMKGLVTMLPWHLPIVSKVEIRTEGQFAAFNDCLYRSMSKAEWLLVIDIDELVFPRHERTLGELFASLRASYKPPINPPSALMFRNAFFYLKWTDDLDAPAPLLTARKTRRWATPHSLKIRSKYAVRPRDAVELGNHFLWEHAPGTTSVGVRTDRALLHHYRENCEYGGDQCLKVTSVVDRTAHIWTRDLVKKIAIQKEALSHSCPMYMKTT